MGVRSDLPAHVPARQVAVGPGGPVLIIFKLIPGKYPFEKAGGEDSLGPLDPIFMHTWHTLS